MFHWEHVDFFVFTHSAYKRVAACLGASSLDRIVKRVRMSCCLHSFLLYKNLFANRAMLSLGKTGGSASGLDFIINNLGMPLWENVNDFSRNFYFAKITVNYALIGAAFCASS